MPTWLIEIKFSHLYEEWLTDEVLLLSKVTYRVKI